MEVVETRKPTKNGISRTYLTSMEIANWSFMSMSKMLLRGVFPSPKTSFLGSLEIPLKNYRPWRPGHGRQEWIWKSY